MVQRMQCNAASASSSSPSSSTTSPSPFPSQPPSSSSSVVNPCYQHATITPSSSTNTPSPTLPPTAYTCQKLCLPSPCSTPPPPLPLPPSSSCAPLWRPFQVYLPQQYSQHSNNTTPPPPPAPSNHSPLIRWRLGPCRCARGISPCVIQAANQ